MSVPLHAHLSSPLTSPLCGSCGVQAAFYFLHTPSGGSRGLCHACSGQPAPAPAAEPARDAYKNMLRAMARYAALTGRLVKED